MVRRPARLSHFERSIWIDRPVDAVFAFTREGESFRRIHPERITPARGTPADTRIEPDSIYHFYHWMVNVLPVRWTVQIVDFVPGERYADLQLRGPFRYFHHTHTCEAERAGTRYRDAIDYCTLLDGWFDQTVVRRILERTFTHRQRTMKALLERPEGSD